VTSRSSAKYGNGEETKNTNHVTKITEITITISGKYMGDIYLQEGDFFDR